MALKDHLTTLGALNILLRELKIHNQLMREVVDELRLAAGRPAKYEAPVANPKGFEPGIVEAADYDVESRLREYARRQGITIAPLDDIMEIAREREWIDEFGELTVS